MIRGFGLLATASLVASSEEIDGECHDNRYPYMCEAMKTLGLGYRWSAYETTTNDNYVLTMFRIIGDENGKKIEG